MTTTHTLSLGPLVLIARQAGPLLDVSITHLGLSVGEMHLSLPAWTGLVTLVDVLAAADRRHAEDRARMDAVNAANDRCLAEIVRLRAECNGRRFDPNLQPILSVLGDYDWSGIEADGWVPSGEYEDALRKLVKAMAEVERSVAK